MEMHQIRYFLAVSRTLNFTRAAAECNVSQPSLTRAIKLLEDEFGGELFRRERNLSHLTELGQRMLPLIQTCYESALGAQSLAKSIRKGEVATLRLALSRTVGIELLTPLLAELMRTMMGLELRFVRGTVNEVADIMKAGDADLAISGPIAQSWDRFDARPLFTEDFTLVVNECHPLAGRSRVDIEELRSEKLLARLYCEMAEPIMSRIRGEKLDPINRHEVASERDLLTLLEKNFGVTLAAKSMLLPGNLRRVEINASPITRTIFVYTVSGRPWSPSAATFMKQLLAADWPALAA